VLASAAIGVSPALADATSNRDVATTPIAHQSSLVGFVCNQLQGPAATGAKALIRRFTQGGFDGGLAVNFVVKLAFTKCESTVNKVGSVIRRFLNRQSKPAKQNPPSSRARYLRYLETRRAETIARQLRPYSGGAIGGAGSVVRLRNALCADARAFRSTASTLNAYVPNARRGSLPPLNAVVDSVIRNCRLSGPQRSYLALGVTSYVIARATRSDFDPPVVLILKPTFAPNGNGTWATRVSWIAFDPTTSVQDSQLWLFANNAWHPLGITTRNSADVTLYRNDVIQFAVRARDPVGNVSSFSYTLPYKT
jgi:hypothetical protein